MGAVGGGGEEKKAVKTATGKIVYKRRLGIRIDMTPMVDIVFLLLIFYMVTTVFAMPQAMEVNLPKKEELETEIETKESQVLIVRVDEEGQMWKNIGRKIPDLISMDTLQAVLIDENQKEGKLATIVTIHPKAKYHHLVDILDEIDTVERRFKEVQADWSYRFTMKPWDREDDRAIQKATERTGEAG
jgi:biopolymer transport protein ExbD